MTDARKNRKTPAPIPAAADEARRTNVLLEELRKEFRVFGEGLAAVRGELKSVKSAVVELDAGLREVTPIVRTLTPVPDELKSLADVVRTLGKNMELVQYSTNRHSHELEAVKTELRLIRSDLNASAKRLTEVETRLAP